MRAGSFVTFVLLAACSSKPALPVAGDAAVPGGPDTGPPAGCLHWCASPPCALAQGEFPFRIAVDGEWVYFTARGWSTRGGGELVDAGPPVEPTGAVLRVSKQGGAAATVLAAGQNFPGYLAVDAEAVYWTVLGDNAVHRVGKDGSNPLTLASASNIVMPDALALGERDVYFSALERSGPGGIYRVPKQGGAAPVPVVYSTAVKGLTVDETDVYFTIYGMSTYEDGAVRKVPRGGGPIINLATNENSPWPIVLHGDRVFWANYGLTTPGSAIKSARRDGTDQRVLVQVAGTGHGPPDLVLDGDEIFWVENDGAAGAVRRARADGGEVRTLATMQDGPNGIAVDRCTVYWSTIGRRGQPGVVWAMPR